jgi:hypothetical protein
MGARPYDPARAIRERLQRIEQRERQRDEAAAVTEGVAETLDLELARGAAFEAPSASRAAAYRRQAGLEWLARKGRLNDAQKAAGERYGACYRRAMQAASIGSTLEIQPGMGSAGPPLSALLAKAEGRRWAEAKLNLYRGQLLSQRDLIAACDRVCGQELTPREAAGGEREAGRLEAVLGVALDILASR